MTRGDEDSPHRLPSVETFHAQHGKCQHCGEMAIGYGGPPECGCQSVGGSMLHRVEAKGEGYFYWHCTPGCLPEGDAMGPYPTETEALAAARECSGVCPHGVPDDGSEEDEDATPCMECPAPTLYVLQTLEGDGVAYLKWEAGADGVTLDARAAAAWCSEDAARREADARDGGARWVPMLLGDEDARAWGKPS